MLNLPRYHLICRLRDRFMAQVTSAGRAGLSSCRLPGDAPYPLWMPSHHSWHLADKKK